jgi:hypothetical protein
MSLTNFFKVKYLIPTVMVLIFVYFGIQRFISVKDLEKNGIMVNATITDFLGSAKGGSGSNPNFCCEFMYKGERKSLISQSSVKSKAFSYIGRTFPALYSAKTNTVRLLMNEEDYEDYNRKYPDSLIERNHDSP